MEFALIENVLVLLRNFPQCFLGNCELNYSISSGNQCFVQTLVVSRGKASLAQETRNPHEKSNSRLISYKTASRSELLSHTSPLIDHWKSFGRTLT